MRPDQKTAEARIAELTNRDGSVVLVTGATGFIGSHLCDRLSGAGAHVRAVSRRPCSGRCPAGVDHLSADLNDPSTARAVLDNVSIVFHLAGMASADMAQSNPHEAFQSNTLATQFLLEASRRKGIDRIVLSSTAHIYGRPRHVPVDETHAPNPLTAYAASKFAADALALAYHRCYGLPAVVLRLFNVYGPRQAAGPIVPTLVSQALEGRPIQVRDSSVQRDFVYVEDVVDAFLCAAVAQGAPGEAFLIGSGEPTSVGELARLVVDLADVDDRRWDRASEPAPGGDCVYGDASKAASMLGWQPRTSVQTGLAQTIRWWQARPAQS